MTDAQKAALYRDALGRIFRWPANGNSDPDVMAAALDDIQRLAWQTLQQGVLGDD